MQLLKLFKMIYLLVSYELIIFIQKKQSIVLPLETQREYLLIYVTSIRQYEND